jgi:hypothetical protein
MKKNVLILFVLIYSVSLNAQKLGIEVLKRNYNYVISDTLTNIHIQFTLKNLSSENLVIVLDATEIGQYYEEKEYLFEVDAEKTGIQQNVFSPRAIFYEEGNSKPMFFDKTYDSPYYIDVKEAGKDFLNKIDLHIQKVKNYGKIYFPKKPFYFVDRAMYINNNLIILKPNEERKFELKFDPMQYKVGTYGFLLIKNKRYDFYLKIHNDKKTIMKHLTKENLQEIKCTKSKFLTGEIYSEKLILVTE